MAHIVVIEDNPLDVQLLEMALVEVNLDFEFTVFQNGADALSWARSYGGDSSQRGVPDLAVVDLNLPKYDGLEILSAMRNKQELSAVPAIVLSSSASPRDMSRVRALPNTAYMTKPMELDQYAEVATLICRMLQGEH